LASPLGRSVLFSPEADRLALGIWQGSEDNAVGLIGLTYDSVDTSELPDAERRFRELLNARRAERGLPPARRLRSEAIETALTQQLALLQGGQTNPDDALGDLLEVAAADTHRGAHGWVALADRIDNLELDDDLVNRDELNLVVGVATWQPEDHPWRLYVVLVAHVGGEMRLVQNAQGAAIAMAPRTDPSDDAGGHDGPGGGCVREGEEGVSESAEDRERSVPVK
jgi:hypothetical protein